MSSDAPGPFHFPEEHEIPEEFRLPNPVVCDRTLDQRGAPRLEGSHARGPLPRLPAHRQGAAAAAARALSRSWASPDALEALDAAVRAYDHGRGLWPTMSVRQRIGHMERFALAMNRSGDEMVRLLMWEIAKTQADAAKRVRPHGRVHPGHHGRPQGPGPGLLPLHPRPGHRGADPAGAPGRGPLHGALQLPPQRDLHLPHPRAHHGQHGPLQAAAPGRPPALPPAGGLPRLLPARAW